jgi:hypothetical protein
MRYYVFPNGTLKLGGLAPRDYSVELRVVEKYRFDIGVAVG